MLELWTFLCFFFLIGENGYVLSCICGFASLYYLSYGCFGIGLDNLSPLRTLSSCPLDCSSFFSGGVILCRCFSMEIIKRIDDVYAQVASVKTCMNLFQIQLKEIQDQLIVLNNSTQIRSDMET